MMKIKVLGSGCSKCEALLAATKEAVQHLGIDAEIEYVTDFAQIARYGVMSTPALVVDEKGAQSLPVFLMYCWDYFPCFVWNAIMWASLSVWPSAFAFSMRASISS